MGGRGAPANGTDRSRTPHIPHWQRTLFLNSVWDGRLRQMAFEFMSMANVKNSPLKIRHGLVAFFDILGFRKMIGSNESGEMHAIVRDILHPILEKVVRIELTTYRLDSSYLAISDSILVYQAQEEQVPGVSDETVARCFNIGRAHV